MGGRPATFVLPGSTERQRFIELGREFRKVFEELSRSRQQPEKREPLLEEMKRVTKEADDLVQRYHEDFGDWDE